MLIINLPSAKRILESKGMRAIFQEKGKKKGKKCLKQQKRAKYMKILAKMYNI